MWSRLFGGPRPPPSSPDLDPADPARSRYGPAAAPHRPPHRHDTRRQTSQQKLMRRIGKKGNGKGCFNMPTGVVVTAMGDIVVVDSENSRVQIFTSDGHLRVTIGEKGHLPHQLNHPMCVTLSRDGSELVMVTDSVNASVKVYMQDGTFVTQYGGSGMFDFPYGIATTSQQYVVVSDVCQHTVHVLYPSGSLRARFGHYGERAQHLDHPSSVAVDAGDRIVVADSGNTCIKRYTTDGHLLQCFSLTDFKLHNEHFMLLAGVCVDGEDNVLVVGNSTVYILAPNGRLWEVVLPSDGLHSPRALSYSPLGGHLVVTQCGLDNRHEVGVFYYNPHDYRSLQTIPRVMVNPDVNVTKRKTRHNKTKRHSAPCRVHYNSLDGDTETNRNSLD